MQSSDKSLLSSQNRERIAFNIHFFFVGHIFFLFSSSSIRCATPRSIRLQECVSECWVPMGHRAEQPSRQISFQCRVLLKLTPGEIQPSSFYNFCASLITAGPGTSQKSQHFTFILFDTYTFQLQTSSPVVSGWFSCHNRFFFSFVFLIVFHIESKIEALH